MNSPISDELAQMQPRSKTPAEKTESSGCTWLLNPAGLSLPVYSQPATSLLVKAADPQTETEGLRPHPAAGCPQPQRSSLNYIINLVAHVPPVQNRRLSSAASSTLIFTWSTSCKSPHHHNTCTGPYYGRTTALVHYCHCAY